MPNAPDDEDDDLQPELTEAWRPELPPPERPAKVPAEATWEETSWRWAAGPVDGAGARNGKWRFWAMNGALLQERELAAGVEKSLVAYYPDGTVAAKASAHADGTTTHESFYADGKPWCVARYVGGLGDKVTEAEVLAEKLSKRDGSLYREVTNERDAQGLVAHRERGPGGLRFENLRTPDGRELRFHTKDGALQLTVKAKKGAPKALAILPPNNEHLIDGSEIGESTTRGQIEPELGGRLFAVTIAGEPQPEGVKAFVAKNPWAKKISDDAPFENASVANFLTALGSKLPHVPELAAVGLGNLVESEKHQKAVIPYLQALGTPAAKDALARLGIAEDDESETEETVDETEHAIGKVTLPSGMLAIVDMGALGQWSHEAPHHADISGSRWANHVTAKRDDFVDLVVTGPQAREALAKFVAEHGASDLFDVDTDSRAHIEEHFAEHCAGLDAKLEVAPERIGHGKRLRLLCDAGLAYADFDFAHVNVVAVFGLPKSGELEVVGRYDEEREWDHVSLVVRATKPVREEKIADLSIEEARFMFGDGEALSAWDHERPLDGLRDFVFWGGAEDDVMESTGAEHIPGNGDYNGWMDLPPGVCPPHIVTRVLTQVEQGGLVAELRPHSSHHAILEGAWVSDDDAGTAVVGGAKMCGLFSSVGDGVFPVYLEYDADGAVCRVTVKIKGAPEEEDEDDEDEDDEDEDDEDEDEEDDTEED